LLDPNDRPIPVAVVSLVTPPGTPPVAAVQTGPDGSFTVVAPAAGVYRIRAVVPGYRPGVTPAVELKAGDQIGVTLHAVPDTAVQLAPMQVTSNNRRPASRLGGFYDRMQRIKMGYFITRDQIDKRHPIRVSDLLATVPGLITQPRLDRIGEDVLSIQGCKPAVYLDGLHYPLWGETIDDIVNPNELEGIEVYTNPATVPAEFGAGSSCGVIALWTRTGA
jgi:hypothetical protein